MHVVEIIEINGIIQLYYNNVQMEKMFVYFRKPSYIRGRRELHFLGNVPAFKVDDEYP